MSQIPLTVTATSSTNFETIFGAALEAYNNQTKKDIASHPLAIQLQSCDSPTAILAILRAQVQAFDQSQSADERWTKWLDPTVNVLYAFSATLGEGVGLAFPPAKAIFAGIGVLLQMSALAKSLLWTCLAAWNTFLSGLKDIYMSDRPQR
ncbi:hypothetical protein H4582DRAFT_2134674 [Lactarius indigo]|nr:hypothetical protein H4582DRAFT_2134674 [Lactarius indigo]